MKDVILLDEDQLIKKAISILNRELGPIETSRFLALRSGKRKDSVKRHREWQATLDKDEFFDQVFKSK